MCAISALTSLPHFLNQAPPLTQQLSLPDFGVTAHLGQRTPTAVVVATVAATVVATVAGIVVGAAVVAGFGVETVVGTGGRTNIHSSTLPSLTNPLSLSVHRSATMEHSPLWVHQPQRLSASTHWRQQQSSINE